MVITYFVCIYSTFNLLRYFFMLVLCSETQKMTRFNCKAELAYALQQLTDPREKNKEADMKHLVMFSCLPSESQF